MNNSLMPLSQCEVCGGRQLKSALDLGLHPMCDDLVVVGDVRICREYPIEILFCPTCMTAHQRYQIPKHELFPHTYHYRSRHTADVISGMRDLAAGCAAEFGDLGNKMVLDVGCNDGSLLSIFKERGAKTFGIEPTGAAEDARRSGHTVINAFLDEQIAANFVRDYGHPDLITFTNVFAHIEDLKALIRSLLLLCHSTTTIVIENHYLGAILDHRQFDTFYHEHPRTYSFTSFTHIANDLGRAIVKVEFPKRYGGNIRITMRERERQAHEQRDLCNEVSAREALFQSDFAALSRHIEIWKQVKRRQLFDAMDRHGRLAGKAFPGRAAIPIKLLGLDESVIAAVYEKPTSAKIGHYVPGTRIPILSDDSFNARPEGGPVVNFAWHIGGEIEKYMRGRGYDGEFIDIINANDFNEQSG